MLKNFFFVLFRLFAKKEVGVVISFILYIGAIINILVIIDLLFDIVCEWTVYFTIENKIRYINIEFYIKIIVDLKVTEEENRTFIYSGTYKYDFWKLIISIITKNGRW